MSNIEAKSTQERERLAIANSAKKKLDSVRSHQLLNAYLSGQLSSEEFGTELLKLLERRWQERQDDVSWTEK